MNEKEAVVEEDMASGCLAMIHDELVVWLGEDSMDRTPALERRRKPQRTDRPALPLRALQGAGRDPHWTLSASQSRGRE